MEFRDYLLAAAGQAKFVFTDRQVEQFSLYYQLLIEWNQKINLTAITQPDEVAVKHIIDSLSCYDKAWFSKDSSLIDVGTGAGFPGMVLKIYRPDIQLTLLDSLNKRLKYLQELQEKLQLTGIQLVHARAEDAGQDKKLREKFTVATSRAVARLNVLSELCLPFVSVDGYFLALKGREAKNEAVEAEAAIRLLGGETESLRPVSLPGLSDERLVIAVKKIKRTPPIYPRRPAAIEKKPL